MCLNKEFALINSCVHKAGCKLCFACISFCNNCRSHCVCVRMQVFGELSIMSQMSDLSLSQDTSQSQTPPSRSEWKESYPVHKVAVPYTPSSVVLPIRKRRAVESSDDTPAMLRRRIAFLESQLAGNDCPRNVDALSRSRASSGRVCTKCGMNHNKVELSRIGMVVYGDHHLKSRARWIKDGIQDYLQRMQAACWDKAVVEDIRDTLSHVEMQISGSKHAMHRQLSRVVVEPSERAVRAHLEKLV